MSPLNNPPSNFRQSLQRKPILCYVTDRHSLRSVPDGQQIPFLLGKIQAFAAAGIDWIQLREKDCSGRDSAALTRDATKHSSLTNSSNTVIRIILNDRLDVAIAERAGGVHLGENSIPPAEAKRLLLAVNSPQTPLKDFLVGVSCHSLVAAQSAASAGADYIFFGPVFATPSKAAFGPPQGLDRLAAVCNSVEIPVLAIGGITLANAAASIAAGASGIAAIRLFQDADDPAEVIRQLRG